jgi:hypothetical protein
MSETGSVGHIDRVVGNTSLSGLDQISCYIECGNRLQNSLWHPRKLDVFTDSYKDGKGYKHATILLRHGHNYCSV